MSSLSKAVGRSENPGVNSNLLGIIRIKVEKILEGSLDSIPSPSPSVKIQTMGGKGYLRL